MLSLSKLANNKTELNPRPNNVSAIVRHACRLYQHQAKSKQIQFGADIPSGDVWGVVDSARVQQVLINLLSNAFKFTAATGNITISLAVTALPSAQQLVTISVKDTVRFAIFCAVGSRDDMRSLSCVATCQGVGLSPEEMDRLFDRFSQANRRVTTEYGGSGT